MISVMGTCKGRCMCRVMVRYKVRPG
jgi:hypothetical protein